MIVYMEVCFVIKKLKEMEEIHNIIIFDFDIY